MTTRASEIDLLQDSWWSRICGIEYNVDVDYGVEDSDQAHKDQIELFIEIIGPAISSFLGLNPLVFPRSAVEINSDVFKDIPVELLEDFFYFLYAIDGDSKAFGPNELEGKNSSDFKTWWNIFTQIVEISPVHLGPVNYGQWNRSSAALYLRRFEASIPRVHSQLHLLYQVQPRVVIANDSRLIDLRLRQRRPRDGRFVSFIFDSHFYGHRQPILASQFQIESLLSLEGKLKETIPRAQPTENLVEVFKYSQFHVEYLELGKCGRINGIYLKSKD